MVTCMFLVFSLFVLQFTCSQLISTLVLVLFRIYSHVFPEFICSVSVYVTCIYLFIYLFVCQIYSCHL